MLTVRTRKDIISKLENNLDKRFTIARLGNYIIFNDFLEVKENVTDPDYYKILSMVDRLLNFDTHLHKIINCKLNKNSKTYKVFFSE